MNQSNINSLAQFIQCNVFYVVEDSFYYCALFGGGIPKVTAGNAVAAEPFWSAAILVSCFSSDEEKSVTETVNVFMR